MRCLTVLTLVAALSACGAPVPVMRPSVDLLYGHASSPGPPVYARGYQSTSGARSDITIREWVVWLDLAPEFIVVFPDGFRVSSRGLSTAVLQEHGPSIGMPWVYADKSYTGWHSADGARVTFQVEAWRAVTLRLCTPIGYTERSKPALLLETMDGTPIPRPVSYGGLAMLFGEPKIVQSEVVLMEWPC